MAISLNKVTLIGNLGADPEIRTMNNGQEVATLSLATSNSWKDKLSGEKKEKTEWHRVVVFNEALVNIVKSYVKKGSSIYIEGSLQTRKWTDNSGVEKFSTEVVLQNFGCQLLILSGRDEASSDEPKSYQEKKYQPRDLTADLDDDIPF